MERPAIWAPKVQAPVEPDENEAPAEVQSDRQEDLTLDERFDVAETD